MRAAVVLAIISILNHAHGSPVSDKRKLCVKNQLEELKNQIKELSNKMNSLSAEIAKYGEVGTYTCENDR